MPDLSTLLHDSAPAPRRPLDLAAVHQRARLSGVRRRLLWLGGLGALLALPGGAGILAPAGDGGDTVDSRRPPAITPDRPAVGDDGPAADAGGTAAPGDGDDAIAAGTGTRGTPTTSPAPASSAADAGAPTLVEVGPTGGADGNVPTPFPSASACAVDDVGHVPGEERRCRFTATAGGGASLRSSGPTSSVGARGRVIITRNGQTTTHEVQYQSVRAGELGAFACGGLIEPGDLVEVVLTTKSTPDDGTVTTLGAGEGWECWNGR
jgi:hypothetical protein